LGSTNRKPLRGKGKKGDEFSFLRRKKEFSCEGGEKGKPSLPRSMRGKGGGKFGKKAKAAPQMARHFLGGGGVGKKPPTLKEGSFKKRKKREGLRNMSKPKMKKSTINFEGGGKTTLAQRERRIQNTPLP